jgi:hypothetical protein
MIKLSVLLPCGIAKRYRQESNKVALLQYLWIVTTKQFGFSRCRLSKPKEEQNEQASPLHP